MVENRSCPSPALLNRVDVLERNGNESWRHPKNQPGESGNRGSECGDAPVEADGRCARHRSGNNRLEKPDQPDGERQTRRTTSGSVRSYE